MGNFIVYSILVLSLVSSASPAANAQTRSALNLQSPVLAYLTDVEGKWQKFADFLKLNPNVYQDKKGKLQLAKGVTFVYGGDATDTGPNNAEVVTQLLDLKTRFPDRVVIIAGNRDLSKLELPEFLNRALSPKLAGYLSQIGADTRTNRIKLYTELVGYDEGFQDRKVELAKSKKRAVTDDETADDILMEALPNGRANFLLEKSQLIYRDGATLFVHGAILEQNLGIVGQNPRKKYADVNDWISELNQWYAERFQHWQKTGDASELNVYNHAVPGTYHNRESVVLARYTDPTGNSRMPSDAFIDYLKQNGVRRIIVGHTPQGDGPTILRHRGFEIIMADNTDAPHGSKLFIEKDRVEVESKVRLASGEQTYKMNWGIDDETLLGHRLSSNDHLLKAKLESGDWLTFQVSPPPTFDVDHQVLSAQHVLKIGVINGPTHGFLQSRCGAVFN